MPLDSKFHIGFSAFTFWLRKTPLPEVTQASFVLKGLKVMHPAQ